MRNIGRDMQFKAAVEYRNQFTTFRMNDRIWCSLSAIQRTFPGILRTRKAVLFSLLTRCRKQAIAIQQQVTCYIRMDIGEVRQHKDFSIVEDMAAIAKACQPFGRYTITAIMR